MALRRVIASLCLLVAVGCGSPGDEDVPTVDGGPETYAAYNLFTGAPRFGVFKTDPARDLCVRLVFIWGEGSGTATLQDQVTTEAMTVTDRAADCASVGGGPPSIEPQGVTAQGATGGVEVTQDGDAWTVAVHGAITFGAIEPWVPQTEPVETTAIEIQGGCC